MTLFDATRIQDVLSLAIQHSRGEDASMQALKDARFIREALAAAGWKLVRWDSGEEAPPVGAAPDEWSVTPGKVLKERRWLAEQAGES